MYRYIILLFLLWPSININAQSLDFLNADTSDQNKDLPRYLVLEGKYQHGIHLTTGVDALEESVESNPYNTFELRVGWRGYGRKRWQQRQKYPTYGVGLHHVAFKPYQNILGNPTSVFGYLDYLFIKNRYFWFGLDVAVGAAFGFKAYDPETNPDQKAIGASLNLLFQPNLNLGFKLNKRFDIAFQAGLTHYSDGRSRTPNKGVNLLGVGFKTVYNIKPFYKNKKDASHLPDRPQNIKFIIPKHKNYFELMASIGAGFTGSFDDFENKDDIYYAAGALSIDGAYKYGHNGRFGIGIDMFYDASLIEEYEPVENQEVPLKQQTYAGIHISHEFLIHRFAVITQYGRTFKEIPGRGKSYVITGARYDVTETFYLKCVLKTPTELIADFAILGAGFTINSKKEKLK